MDWRPIGSPKLEKKRYFLKRTPLKKKHYKIAKVSKKQAKKLTVRSKLKKKLNYTVCSKCGITVVDYKELDSHHIQSKGRCGEDTKENTEPLCRKCHMIKTGILGLKNETY